MKTIRRKRSWFFGLTIAILLTIFAFAGIRHVWLDPGIPLLVSEEGAEWIRLHEPSRLPIRWLEPLTTHFRYRLDVERIPEKTVLTLRSMKQAAVYLDGSLLFQSPTDRQRWKESHQIDLSPWNYEFMLSNAWLSLLPMAAMIIGAAVAVLSREGGPQGKMLRFAICSVLLYLAASFYIFLTVPILSSANDSYALGLTPCFALLGAKGFEVLTRQRILRAVIHGLLACWVIASYAAYFVI